MRSIVSLDLLDTSKHVTCTDCHICIGCLRGRVRKNDRIAALVSPIISACILQTEFSFCLLSPVLSESCNLITISNITLTRTLQQNRYIKNYNVRRNVEGSRLSALIIVCVYSLSYTYISLRLIRLIFVLLKTKTAFVTCGAVLLSDLSI